MLLTDLAKNRASVPANDDEAEFLFSVTNDGKLRIGNVNLLALYLSCMSVVGNHAVISCCLGSSQFELTSAGGLFHPCADIFGSR